MPHQNPFENGTLHCADYYFDADTISDTMPAFVSRTYDPSPSVYVKYPTYKILIQDLPGSEITADDPSSVDELLGDVKNRSKVYLTRHDSLTITNNLAENITVESDFPYCCEVVCLNISLEENKACRDKMQTLHSKYLLQSTFICNNSLTLYTVKKV